MRATHIAARAALVCGAAGVICALWSATDDTAARAADNTPTILTQTGALLDDVTAAPDRITDRLPAPAAKPVRTVVKQAAPALEPVRQVVRHVEATTDTLPVRVHLADAPVATRSTKPASPPRRPAKRPAAVEQLVNALTASGQLATAPAIQPAVRLLAVNPAAVRAADPGTPADTPPADHYGQACAGLTQPNPSVDQHATPPGGPSAPALLLLDQLLPRAGLPASHTTHLDPRPA